MTSPSSAVLAELVRSDIVESVHTGAAVVCTADGTVVEAFGDPSRLILPRSSCKMLQALPLVESGAAAAAGLGPEQLALACASHSGGAMHTARVDAWLATIGAGEVDLRCGAHDPTDPEARALLAAEGIAADQRHNNCSGKHTGFVTLARHLGAGPDYIEIDHPVQRAVRAAIAEICGQEPAGHAIDGCSAPNFAVTLQALATAMARFADAENALDGARREAALSLVAAMAAHPVLVGGPTRPNTQLIEAAHGRAVAKSGAEGVYVAILRERGLGIALKVDDGAERAARAAIGALMARYGVFDPLEPAVSAIVDQSVYNCNGWHVAVLRAASALRPA